MLHPRSALRFSLIAALGLLPLAGPGCDKPDDRPALEGELRATARDHDARLDELRRRADELDRRRLALPHDTLASASVEHSLARARATIDGDRGYLQGQQADLARIPRAAGELRRGLDEMRQRLRADAIEVTADLEAVESWVAIAEQPPREALQPAAEPPAPGDDRAPETDSSGAPIR